MLAPEVRGSRFNRSFASVFTEQRAFAVLCVLLAFISIIFAKPVIAETKSARLVKWTAGGKPNFILRDIAGKEVSLASLRGRVVLVHFFATWCEPCREELPALQRLIERGTNRNVSVIAISVAEVPDRVNRFMDKMTIKFLVLLDQDRSVTKNWGVQTLPSTVVLDTKLRPRLMVESDYGWDNLDLENLLARLSGAKLTSSTREERS